MTQGEAVKQLRDERQQAEKKEAQLKVGGSSIVLLAWCGALTTKRCLFARCSIW